MIPALLNDVHRTPNVNVYPTVNPRASAPPSALLATILFVEAITRRTSVCAHYRWNRAKRTVTLLLTIREFVVRITV